MQMLVKQAEPAGMVFLPFLKHLFLCVYQGVDLIACIGIYLAAGNYKYSHAFPFVQLRLTSAASVFIL